MYRMQFLAGILTENEYKIKIGDQLNEVSIDQLRTQFVDSGKISGKIFKNIEDASLNKSAYATWLTKKLIDGFFEDNEINQYKDFFSIFDRRKKEYPFQDINQYKTSKDILDFESKSHELIYQEKLDPSQQKGVSKSNKYQDFYIGSVDGFDVYELPKGRKDLYGVSCELGSGTDWCTSTGKERKFFDKHIKTASLFIFINPATGEKYQFDYYGKEYRDKNDNDILKLPIGETNFYNLFSFIESKYSNFKSPLSIKLLYQPDSLTGKDLNIKGVLSLESISIPSLPDGLTITGNFSLIFNSLKSLPDNLTVGKKLWVAYNKIDSIPNNLKVGGDLDLRDNKFPKKKYSEDEIRKMIEDKGGYVKGKIFI